MPRDESAACLSALFGAAVAGTFCAMNSDMRIRTNQRRGVTLTELLCVIAILAILAALYLPAIAHAYVRVKKFLTGG